MIEIIMFMPKKDYQSFIIHSNLSFECGAKKAQERKRETEKENLVKGCREAELEVKSKLRKNLSE